MGCSSSKDNAIHPTPVTDPSAGTAPHDAKLDDAAVRLAATEPLKDGVVNSAQEKVIEEIVAEPLVAAAVVEAVAQEDPLLKEFPQDPLGGREFTLPEGAEETECQKGVTYQGGWLNGKKHGIGLLKYDDGSKYLGEFAENMPNGLGIYTRKDGTEYQGEFKTGKANGYGVYSFADGTKYYGNFVEDRREGRGMEVHPDGMKYVGEHKKGVKSGKGNLIAPNGEVYEGDFALNEIQGEGTYTWQDGKVYKGHWERSKQHGTGELYWPDGRVYKGNYVDGKINGKGIMTWPDGRMYDGMWKNGLQNGEGNYYATRGEYRRGMYLDGVRVRWLGEPVQVTEQEANVMPVVVAEVVANGTSGGMDNFLEDLQRMERAVERLQWQLAGCLNPLLSRVFATVLRDPGVRKDSLLVNSFSHATVKYGPQDAAFMGLVLGREMWLANRINPRNLTGNPDSRLADFLRSRKLPLSNVRVAKSEGVWAVNLA